MKKIFTLFLTICISVLPAIAEEHLNEYMNISFWQKFNDENLTDNLLKMYENNNDLKAAVLKVNEANRVVKMSFANELPSLGFEGYVGRIFKSSDEIFGDIVIPNYAETHYYFPITMNYEIDIWGQNHLKTKSKKKQLEIIRQDERSAYIYISSAFVANYYNLIRFDKLIDYQKELISIQEQIINSYKIRYMLGTATISNIDNAEKELTYMKEDLHKLFEKQKILKNQLSVLLSDRTFDDIPRADYDDLNVNFEAPEGIDFNILSSRPDRIKTELELERIGIDVKIAKRDFLPKFIITGNLGFNLYNISSPHTFLANLGVAPIWDLFLGGRKIHLLKIKKNQYQIAEQKYEKAILSSIQETNDALYSMKTAHDIQKIVCERMNTDIMEAKNTEIRIDAGTADKLDKLIQEEKILISKKQYVSSYINKIITSVNLYQALGGVDFTEYISL